jgi:acyl dehydratase
MVNPQIEGKTYPRTASYLVGREKIREFAKAVFSKDPANLDLEAAKALGYQDLIAPLTTVLADKEAAIDFSRVVHGDQRFIHERPIVAGDELTSELKVASVKTLAGNAMVTFETQIFDAGNALVCTAISTLVVRGEA